MHTFFMVTPQKLGVPTSMRQKLMDAINLLKADHKTVRDLLDELAETTPSATKKRTALLGEIRVQLKAHSTIEEEVLYPAFHASGSKSEDAKMFFEALEEHRAAGDLVLPELMVTGVDSEKFSGIVSPPVAGLGHMVRTRSPRYPSDGAPGARWTLAPNQYESTSCVVSLEPSMCRLFTGPAT